MDDKSVDPDQLASSGSTVFSKEGIDFFKLCCRK